MGATPQSAGLVGLVPAPELGQTDLFLRSDGTWSSPSAIDHFVLTIENKNHKSHYDLILEAIENLDCISGDIIIIKDLISNNKWQYVAYVFDNGNWHAMDGNYNAENVYFDEDLITTTEIGNITLTDGKAVIATAGKNLKEVFETIFVKEENPTIVDPYIILTCKEAKVYEVGTVIKPTYSASLNSGTYSFGPATGVTVTGWSIVDSNGNGSVNNSGEFVDFIVKDNIDYSITATAMYSNGNIPLTNLGNKYPEGAIKAGSTTITQKLVSGFRKSFYGTVANKDELTSDLIRSLVHYDTQLMPKASVKVNLPIGALKMIFAYPANLPDLESIKDTNGFEANILNSFKKEIMKIEGNNHYEPIDYKVYTIEFANPYSTANYYTFTVGEED